MIDPEELLQRTGCPVHPAYFPSKLLWFREKLPDVFGRVQCVHDRRVLPAAVRRQRRVQPLDGIRHRTAEPSDGGWDAELLSTLGVGESCSLPSGPGFADPRNPSSVRPALAALRDAAWFPPLSDGACSNVGSGCESADRIALMIGTTGAMRAVRPAGSAPVPQGLWAYRLDRGREMVGGVLGDGEISSNG